ncbi:hypothetical protein RN22_21250 [Grimontia sp. AD028]|nr:hypothetical protein RN22_21250 [Grimontia sp. AD028]
MSDIYRLNLSRIAEIARIMRLRSTFANREFSFRNIYFGNQFERQIPVVSVKKLCMKNGLRH